MKKTIFVLFAMLSTWYSAQTIAQIIPTPSWTWAKNIEGVPAVATTDDGSLFTDNAGNSFVVNQVLSRVNIKRYDALGNLVWNRTGSSGSQSETPTDITVDTAGNYYVTGSFVGTAVFGSTNLIGSTSNEIFIVKYNAIGVVQWAQKQTGAGSGRSVSVDAAGNVFVGGSLNNSLFYAKYNASGVVQWTKVEIAAFSPLSTSNIVNDLSIDNFGNTYITGSYIQSGLRFFIRKIDPSGNTVWQRNRTDASVGNDIVTDNVGNSYVTGVIYLSATNFDIFTTKYDAAGRVIWTKTAGGPDKDFGDGIAIDANGNCYVSGRFQSDATFASIAISNLNSGISDIFVAKYDNLGDIQWVQQAGASGEEGASKIGLDGAANCYISGFYTISTTFGTTVATGITRQPLLAKIGNAVEGSRGISTLPLASRNYNAGSAISVPFSTRGTFAAGTTYTVELSDPTGSFFFPKTIGVGLTSPISCVIPALTIPAADYRVRVVCASPTVTGTDNGSAITINGNSQLTTPDWSWANNITGVPVATVTGAGSIFTDTAGNSYVVNLVGTDVNIKRYDAAGALTWNRTGSSGTGVETPTDITADAAGNYYITGSYTGTATFGSTTLTNSGGTDIFIVKYNDAGVVQWAVKDGEPSDDKGNSIVVDASGNCYVGGSSFLNWPRNFYAKYNSSGAVQWRKIDIIPVSGSFNNQVRGIAVDSFGNTYMTGVYRVSTTDYAYVRKTDPSGNIVWERNRPELSQGNDIVTDAAGNSYVTGAYFNTENYNVFTTKYNAAGVVTWTQNGIGSDAEYGDGIALDAQGNCFVTGRFQHSTDFSTLNVSNTSSGISDIFVAKYNSAGSILWLQQAGESGQDAGSKIGVDVLGNCYINGYYTAAATFGSTTLSGVNFNPFIAKIGISAETTLGAAVVMGNNFCGGVVITVDFAITGKYNTGNVFTAQLSNATGSFATPVNIGTSNSVLNTSIYAIIPLATPAGTGYRIRVVSSSPTLTGSSNAVDIRINQPNCVNNIVTLNSSPIAAVEYFIDEDPGVGLGTPLATIGGQTIATNYNIVLPTLTPGFHNLFIRTKNADGKWGMYEGRVFYVQPTTVVLNSSPVVAAEFFFNNDPGVGSGTALTAFASSQTLNVTTTVPTTGLAAGFHNLFIRTKSANGQWGMYDGRVVYIQPTATILTVSPIVAAEYFYNTDPGVGLGTAISTGAASPTIVITTSNLPTAPLSGGAQNIFIRFKNNAGQWGLAERRMFSICTNILAAPVVSGAATLCPGSQLNLTVADVVGATSYKWTGPNNYTATGKSITINSVTANNAGVYTVVASNGATTCGDGNPTKTTVIVGTTAAPTGLEMQTFVSGTLTNIVLSGSGIKWYASASDASTRTNVLPNTTVLVNNTTYYATQTINGCESASSKAVTVTVTLSVNEFDANAFTYYPNPVDDELNLSYSYGLTSVRVTDILGRQLYFKKLNEDSAKVDMSSMVKGVYFVEVTSQNSSKTIKVIKE